MNLTPEQAQQLIANIPPNALPVYQALAPYLISATTVPTLQPEVAPLVTPVPTLPQTPEPATQPETTPIDVPAPTPVVVPAPVTTPVVPEQPDMSAIQKQLHLLQQQLTALLPQQQQVAPIAVTTSPAIPIAPVNTVPKTIADAEAMLRANPLSLDKLYVK